MEYYIISIIFLILIIIFLYMKIKTNVKYINNVDSNSSNSSNSSSGTINERLTVNFKDNWIASNIGAPNKNRVVIGNLNNQATIGSHNSQLNAWTPLYLNKDVNGPSAPVFTSTLNVNNELNVSGYSSFKGGKSEKNEKNWGSHFPWSGDGLNYIRGDTKILGHTEIQKGNLNISEGSLCIGTTCIDKSDLDKLKSIQKV